MNTLAKNYAMAVLALRNEGKSEREIAKGLRAVLSRRGHTALSSGIMRALEALEAKRRIQSDATLSIADTSDAEHYGDEISIACSRMNLDEKTIRTEIDPNLIGGYVLAGRDVRYDASYRKTLETLYNSIVRSLAGIEK